MVRLFWVSIISMFFFSSCQKEISGELPVFTPPNTNWNTTTPTANTHVVRQLLNSFQPPAAINSFLNATGIFLNLGDLNIGVPAGCFVKQDNSPVTGMVDLKVKKAMKFADMIYYGLGTLTSSGLLSTDGMVNLEATQGTDILKVASGKKIELYFAKSSGNNYLGFAGVNNANAANPISWNVNTQWQTDTISFGQTGAGYTRIKVDSCQWINCDYFYNKPNPTNIYLKLPAAYGNTNTACFIIFRTDKVLCGLFADPTNQRYFQGPNYTVPIGKNVRLVAISKKDNKNYYGFADVTISADQTITINTMEEVTDADLQIRLNAL